MSPSDLERYCAHCGMKGTLHGGARNPHRAYACPANGKAPTWPKLAKYWTARKTSFRPIK